MRVETRYLRRFDDFIKFELLLIIISKEPEPEWNIARYLNAMTTAPQSDSRMNHFVRDMIRMGALDRRCVHFATCGNCVDDRRS